MDAGRGLSRRAAASAPVGLYNQSLSKLIYYSAHLLRKTISIMRMQ